MTDAISPVTSIQKEGVQGVEGWHRSNVILALNGQDENSGLLKTIYSVDNGKTFEKYTAPVTVGNEGITKIIYYSTDKAGNTEQPKELEVKIDKKSPELTIQFNPKIRQLEGSGEDNLSGIESLNQTDTTIIAKDKAGNTTQFDVSMNNSKTNARVGIQNMTIKSLSYNNKVTAIPQTTLNAIWNLDKNNQMYYLIQTYMIKNQERIIAIYNDNKNRSTVIEKTKGQKVDKSTLKDLQIIKLKSNKGKLQLESS